MIEHIKMNKFIEKINALSIIRFLLLITPFTFLFYFSTTSYGFLSSKILGISVILIIILFTILINIHKTDFFIYVYQGIEKLKKDTIFKTISIFILATFISTLNSKYLFTSFAGSFLRWDGFLTLFCIYLYIFFAYIFFTKEHIKKLAINILIVSIIVFTGVFISFRLNIYRPESYIGNPIFVSQFFLLNLFFIFYLRKDLKKIIFIFLLLIPLLGILFTSTRGVFVGILGAIFITSIIWTLSKRKIYLHKKIDTKKIGLAILLCVLVILPTFLYTKKMIFWKSVPVFNRLIEINTNDPTTLSRIVNNKISYDIFVDLNIKEKMVGVGPELYVSKWYKSYDPLLNKYDTSYFDRAHNMLFDLLIMKGILGFLIFFYLLYVVFKKALLINFEIFSVTFFILISYIIQGLFAFDSYTTTILFFIIFLFISKTADIKTYEK